MFDYPIVRVVPMQPHSLAFGGFEMQMISAMDAVKDLNVNIAQLDFWSLNKDYNIIHLWGFSNKHYDVIEWAKRGNKRIVVSGLLHSARFRHVLSSRLPRRFNAYTPLREMLKMVDELVVVSQNQKMHLVANYRVNPAKVSIIPNIVDDAFFAEENNGVELNLPCSNYVLTVGNICTRKNQLLLANVCAQLNVPLVIVGDVLPGEENYGQLLRECVERHDFIHWIGALKPASPELVSIFKSSIVFALPSFSETQPISALEAIAVNKPLLLADVEYARQDIFKHAVLVRPSSADSIKTGVLGALNMASAGMSRSDLIGSYTRHTVGQSYLDVYCRALSSQT